MRYAVRIIAEMASARRHADLERQRYAARAPLLGRPHELLAHRGGLHAVRQERRPASRSLLGLAHGVSAGLETDSFAGTFVPKTMSSGIGERAPRQLREHARVRASEHAPDELPLRAERGMGWCLQFESDELEQLGSGLHFRAWRGRPRFGRASARAARSGLPCRDCEAARPDTAHERGDSRGAAGKGFPV